jgi:hypothetical protein
MRGSCCHPLCAQEFTEFELKGPPPAPQFLFEPPTLFQQDVDLVRLTAQFVARNGRDFLTRLIQQEASNYQFDFLKPHNVLFTYFQKMVEQYSKVLFVLTVCSLFPAQTLPIMFDFGSVGICLLCETCCGKYRRIDLVQVFIPTQEMKSRLLADAHDPYQVVDRPLSIACMQAPLVKYTGGNELRSLFTIFSV